MTQFNWFKAIGFGAIIWAVMFVFASVLEGYDVTTNIGWELAIAAVMGVTAYVLAVNTKIENPGHALGYGLMFVAVGVVLDLIISQQFVTGLFNTWTYYLGYALVLFAPLVEFGFRGSTHASVLR